ncbi:PIG-L deacetylase family protein [Methylobacterium nigriterrae]|uniref:PIG-L deacetylase family protein n=1 Tax=Methylobacterium nigriterrae TaxID=3127512 RepID=UPI0030141BAE
MRADAFLLAAEALPFGDLQDLAVGRGLVIVAPHPDDESLGCGGLIARACEEGLPVHLVVVSDGVGSHPNSPSYPPERLRALREKETLAAAELLGLAAKYVHFLRLPDRHVPSAGPEAEGAALAIAGAVRTCGAGNLIVTWPHDPHCDHQASAELARLACSKLADVRLLAYPVWGWTLPADTDVGPPPRGLRLDISGQLVAKNMAVAAHRSQTTDLINDDPKGFRLEAAMLAHFTRPFEIFLEI